GQHLLGTIFTQRASQGTEHQQGQQGRRSGSARKKERYVKAPARFVSTLSRFGFGRGEDARTAELSNPLRVKGSIASSIPRLALSVFAAMALFVVWASAASAAPAAQPGYGFFKSFPTETQGLFNWEPSNPVAIDSHGNIFVPDR